MAEQATATQTQTPPSGVSQFLPEQGSSQVSPESAGLTGTPPAAAATPSEPGTPSNPATSPETSGARPEGDASGPSVSTLLQLLGESELRNHPSIGRYNSVEALAQAHVNLETKLGERGVTIPAEDAASETWGEFWKQIPGYPEAPEGYGISTEVLSRILPEGALAPGAEHLGNLQEICHQEGMTVRQISKILEWYGGWMGTAVQEAVSQRHQQGANQLVELEKVWGLNTQQNMTIAQEFVKRRFGDNTQFLEGMIGKDGESEGTILSMSPEIALMCYELAMVTGTDRFVNFQGGGAMSPQQAQAKIDEARQQQAAGAITNEDLGRVINQYGPLASQGRGQQPGTIGDPMQEYTV